MPYTIEIRDENGAIIAKQQISKDAVDAAMNAIHQQFLKEKVSISASVEPKGAAASASAAKI